LAKPSSEQQSGSTMALKRKHDETSDAPDKDARVFSRGGGGQPFKRKRPQLNHDSDKGASAHALKNRIRDLKRLLAHVDLVGDHKMSASMRIDRERELEACEHELAEKMASSREAAHRQKMISRYHHVRFFGTWHDGKARWSNHVNLTRTDRKKAMRILKRLKKEYAAEGDGEKKHMLEKKVHDAEVDVNYAIYYPLMKPYTAMYPKSRVGQSDDQESEAQAKSNSEVDGPKGDKDMWRAVEKATEEGTLGALRSSRHGLPVVLAKEQIKTPSLKPKAPVANPKTIEGRNRRERRAHNARLQEAAEDSDGGFFE